MEVYSGRRGIDPLILNLYIRWRLAVNFTPSLFVCLFMARMLPGDQGLLIHEISRSHTVMNQSVGLLWTSHRLAAETST